MTENQRILTKRRYTYAVHENCLIFKTPSSLSIYTQNISTLLTLDVQFLTPNPPPPPPPVAVRQSTQKDVSPSLYVSIRWSTDRISQKCKIDTSFHVSNQFFLNWLFSWEFSKEIFFIVYNSSYIIFKFKNTIESGGV